MLPLFAVDFSLAFVCDKSFILQFINHKFMNALPTHNRQKHISIQSQARRKGGIEILPYSNANEDHLS